MELLQETVYMKVQLRPTALHWWYFFIFVAAVYLICNIYIHYYYMRYTPSVITQQLISISLLEDVGQ